MKTIDSIIEDIQEVLSEETNQASSVLLNFAINALHKADQFKRISGANIDIERLGLNNDRDGMPRRVGFRRTVDIN